MLPHHVRPTAECYGICSGAQSCLTLCNLMDCRPPGSSAHEFFRQEYWRRVPFPTPGDLPDPGIEPESLASPALAGEVFNTSATWEAHGRMLHLTHTVETITRQISKD